MNKLVCTNCAYSRKINGRLALRLLNENVNSAALVAATLAARKSGTLRIVLLGGLVLVSVFSRGIVSHFQNSLSCPQCGRHEWKIVEADW